MPIKTRIDMLATGIKTPVGIKVAGPDLARTGTHRLAKSKRSFDKCPDTLSVFAERVMGGNYIEFNIDRDAIARYGLTRRRRAGSARSRPGRHAADHHGRRTGTLRVNLRYSRDFRENLEALREIIVPTPTGAQVPLGQLAKIEVVHAPMGIKSEGAVPNAWIYVDVKGIDIGTYVQMRDARRQRGSRPTARSSCRAATTFSGAASTNTCSAPSSG